MDALAGIAAGSSANALDAYASITPLIGLPAAELAAAAAGTFGSASAVVEISAMAQLMSDAAAFQNEIGALQQAAAAAGGSNFVADVARLAAEAQGLIDAFNMLQVGISNAGGVGDSLAGTLPAGPALAQSLDNQVQATFDSGNPALRTLSQLGITLQASANPGGASSLGINFDTLAAAFSADAAASQSVVSQAAAALAAVVSNAVAQMESQYSSLAAVAQTTSVDQMLSVSLDTATPSGAGYDLADLLALESATGPNASTTGYQWAILATSEFSLVSNLLGPAGGY